MSMNKNFPITPEDFWNSFKEYCAKTIKPESDSTEGWRKCYGDDKKWTHFILNTLDEMGRVQFGFTEKFQRAREFYRLDLSFYSYTNPNCCRGNDWHLEVAIEHENNTDTWMEEVVKLSHIQCGLRVLIAYYDYSTGEGGLIKQLEAAAKLIMSRKYGDNKQNWLYIFGNSTGNNEPYKYSAWKLLDNAFVPFGDKFMFPKY